METFSQSVDCLSSLLTPSSAPYEPLYRSFCFRHTVQSPLLLLPFSCLLQSHNFLFLGHAKQFALSRNITHWTMWNAGIWGHKYLLCIALKGRIRTAGSNPYKIILTAQNITGLPSSQKLAGKEQGHTSPPHKSPNGPVSQQVGKIPLGKSYLF